MAAKSTSSNKKSPSNPKGMTTMAAHPAVVDFVHHQMAANQAKSRIPKGVPVPSVPANEADTAKGGYTPKAKPIPIVKRGK